MKPFRKRFAELFGFDRRERRGTYVLAVLLVVLLLVRVFTLRPDTEHLNDAVSYTHLTLPPILRV